MADTPHIAYFGMGSWPIYFGFTTSPKAFAREVKRLGIREPVPFLGSAHANATAHYLDHSDGTLCVIVTMQKPGKRAIEQVAALLAHEATHVAQELWERIGEKEPGREAEAYLVQMIVQCCLQVALKTGRERREVPDGC